MLLKSSQDVKPGPNITCLQARPFSVGKNPCSENSLEARFSAFLEGIFPTYFMTFEQPCFEEKNLKIGPASSQNGFSGKQEIQPFKLTHESLQTQKISVGTTKLLSQHPASSASGILLTLASLFFCS